MSNELILPSNILCGYFDSNAFGPIKVTPKRVSTMFEIEYFLEEGKNIFFNDTTYRVQKNYVHISSPGDIRNSELPFKTKYLKFNVEGQLAQLLKAAPRYFYIYRSFEALALLDEIITLYACEERNEVLLQGKILTYVSLLLEEANSLQKASSYKRAIVMQAQSYIKEHFDESLNLADVAKQVNLSPNYFHTIFTEVCGISPHDYLMEYRVSAVKNLLITADITLSDIAERCGFKTQQYMSSIFKSKVECSPAQFRKQHHSAYLVDYDKL